MKQLLFLIPLLILGCDQVGIQAVTEAPQIEGQVAEPEDPPEDPFACPSSYKLGTGELLIKACDSAGDFLAGVPVTATRLLDGASKSASTFSAGCEGYNLVGADEARPNQPACDGFWPFQLKFDMTHQISASQSSVLIRWENLTSGSPDARMRIVEGQIEDLDCIGGARCYSGPIGPIELLGLAPVGGSDSWYDSKTGEIFLLDCSVFNPLTGQGGSTCNFSSQTARFVGTVDRTGIDNILKVYDLEFLEL